MAFRVGLLAFCDECHAWNVDLFGANLFSSANMRIRAASLDTGRKILPCAENACGVLGARRGRKKNRTGNNGVRHLTDILHCSDIAQGNFRIGPNDIHVEIYELFPKFS